ncbi:hypothetical protein [Hoeflea sp. TYP-13]|uniref:hypothetical protein n=1 Tax=Hoeflea sp. TYP-13 TaxID=3230023 RepID=UPI0034C5CAEC
MGKEISRLQLKHCTSRSEIRLKRPASRLVPSKNFASGRTDNRKCSGDNEPMERIMTMIIDHSVDHASAGYKAIASAAFNRINPFSERARAARRTRREHEQLMAMSNYELHDIGMIRGDVAFGISSGRGVFRETDR